MLTQIAFNISMVKGLHHRDFFLLSDLQLSFQSIELNS